jgi:hypothetical protein
MSHSETRAPVWNKVLINSPRSPSSGRRGYGDIPVAHAGLSPKVNHPSCPPGARYAQ